MSRSTPFELVFTGLVDRFDRLRGDLVAGGKDAAIRDVLLLEREAAEVLHFLRPDEGFGEATETVAALFHHAYLFWANGEPVRAVAMEELRRILAGAPARPALTGDGGSRYVQLPPLAVWGVLAEGPPEPLDGWFRTRTGDTMHALAILGLRPGRDGFTALEVSGPAPGLGERDPTTPLFAPVISETQVPAGIGAVTSDVELLELCWRAEAIG